MLTLRPYQERALSELYDYLQRHSDKNPIVNMVVGAGKSVVIAELCRRALEEFPETRIVMTVASRELCQQNLEKLRTIWPDAPAGVCSASLGQQDLDSQIIFATIGSIAKKAIKLGRCDMLLVDECHNINTKDQGMYRSFINDLKRFGNPYLCVIGFTGTPFRGNGVWLHHGEDPLFHGIATNVTMTELLDSGHLSPLIVDSATPQNIDTTGIRVQAGDYVISDLEKLVLNGELINNTVQDIIARGQNRKKWLIFCVTVAHAEQVLASLKTHGVNAGMVTAKTPSKERAQILQNYKKGNLRALVNIATLTTGFDAPDTDLVALLRPTKSPVLYVQIAGRGMRIAGHKTDCLWLDYTATTGELGPVNLIKGRKAIRRNADEAGLAPIRICENCGNECHAAAKACPDCGHEFPVDLTPSHGAFAGMAQPLLDTRQLPKEVWFDVDRVFYSKHYSRDPNKPPTLKVTYFCGLNVVDEWKSFEADGYAYRMAITWWVRRNNRGAQPVPKTIDEALDHTEFLSQPARIKVIKNGQFWQVRDYEFAATTEQAGELTA